jgi:hypothetical protein
LTIFSRLIKNKPFQYGCAGMAGANLNATKSSLPLICVYPAIPKAVWHQNNPATRKRQSIWIKVKNVLQTAADQNNISQDSKYYLRSGGPPPMFH